MTHFPQHYAWLEILNSFLKNKTIVPQGKDFIILNNGIEYAKAQKQKIRSVDAGAKTGGY